MLGIMPGHHLRMHFRSPHEHKSESDVVRDAIDAYLSSR